MMNEYYYTKCLHPRKILNPYTQQSILVPCGHCEVCENAKSSVNSIRCHAESLHHEYMYFVTLTYSSENLPTASLVPIIEHYDEPDKHGYHYKHSLQDGYYVVNNIDGEILGEYYPKKWLDVHQVVKKCNITSEHDDYKQVPILYKPDVQLFMKRLRKFLKKYTDERIRYFCCGEYGPKHYRPHYHLLLWFEEEVTATYIHEAVSQCWRLGRTDCSKSFGGASNYVARYVNGNCNLPIVFRLERSAPFSTHSQHLGDQIFECKTETFEEHEPESAMSVSIPYGSSFKKFSLWRSAKHSTFPKCQGFHQKSPCECAYSYTIYDVARRWTEETKVIDVARKIVNHIFLFGTCHVEPRIEKLLKYFYNSVAYELSEHQPFNFDKFQTNVYRQLLTSKYFITHLCKNDLNRVPFMVKQIKSYYNMCDRELLQKQLKIQEENDDFKGEFYFINLWTDETIHDLKDDINYQLYRSQIKEKIRNGQKHKEANDLNGIFNYI